MGILPMFFSVFFSFSFVIPSQAGIHSFSFFYLTFLFAFSVFFRGKLLFWFY